MAYSSLVDDIVLYSTAQYSAAQAILVPVASGAAFVRLAAPSRTSATERQRAEAEGAEGRTNTAGVAVIYIVQ